MPMPTTQSAVTKNETVEALITWARALKAKGETYVEIDRQIGCPRKWGGRLAWMLCNRPRQEWEAPGTAPEPEPPAPPVVAPPPVEREAFSFRTADGKPVVGRFCSACGTPLAGPFCSACGTRAVALPETPVYVARRRRHQ
jgi:hypothetical protein